ncbi:MAG: YHS domain-containing protein [Ardenticatenaceae bacterium]|nr:YHS domain-containing protein [Ardenticatenaceae bacterium]
MIERSTPCTHVGHGVRVALDWDYHRLAHDADLTIRKLTAPYPRAGALYVHLLADPHVLTLWDLTGYMAVEKCGLNDHGQMHAQIVAANALQFLSLLMAGGVEPDVAKSGAGSGEDAATVVLAAALLHDVGNLVARDDHQVYSVMLAERVLARRLADLSFNPAQAQILNGFILSAIASHDCTPTPVTLEGAIVAVADAADMTRGRGQVAFDRGQADIHAVSAMAIREVTIRAGVETPVHIEVVMDNPAGLFQVEKLLAYKLIHAGLERYVSLQARVVPPSGESDGAFHCLVLHQGRLHPEGLARPAAERWPLDPVCGMATAPEHSVGSVHFEGIRYFFCSDACLARFRADPSRYTPDMSAQTDDGEVVGAQTETRNPAAMD